MPATLPEEPVGIRSSARCSEVGATNADFKKVYDSMTAFSNNGYQWFQVAEVGYDNFMARHSQSSLRQAVQANENPGARAPGFFVAPERSLLFRRRSEIQRRRFHLRAGRRIGYCCAVLVL